MVMLTNVVTIDQTEIVCMYVCMFISL